MSVLSSDFDEEDGTNSDRIERQYEIFYDVPNIDMNFTYRYRIRKDQQKHFEEKQIEGEMYVKFKEGYSGKIFYKEFTNTNEESPFPDIYFELQRSTPQVYFKTQYRMSAWDTPFERNVFGVEVSVNLTDKLKAFGRLMTRNADYINTVQKNIFGQLTYSYTNDLKFYFEYGAGWAGDNDLVNDNDFAESSGDPSTTNQLKLNVQANF